MTFEWSEWTKEEFPSTECKHIELIATITVIYATEKNGERVRSWEVKSHGKTIASGYTDTSSSARYLCEMIMEHEGREVGNWLLRSTMNRSNPRQG